MSKIPEWLSFAEVERNKHTLRDLAEMFDTPLRLTQHSSTRWTCLLSRVEVKMSSCLSSEYGDGATPEEAAINYAKRLSFKRLVYNAYGDSRKEFVTGEVITHRPEPTQ